MTEDEIKQSIEMTLGGLIAIGLYLICFVAKLI